MSELITEIAKKLNVEPEICLAVFQVESSGSGFDSNNRLIIRFETHLFFDFWGKENFNLFYSHYSFSKGYRAKDHFFRVHYFDNWQPVHKNQISEYKAFNLGVKFDNVQALKSISMGAPQILGMNYELAGFKSVTEMYESFCSGINNQVKAFFVFLGNHAGGKCLKALREKDFENFEKYYNGRKDGVYANLMKQAYDKLKS